MGDIPKFVTTSDWAALSGLLIPFGVLVVLVFGLAGSMLFAHGLIPSLAGTRELPDPRLAKLRPLLYLSAAGFLVLIVITVAIIFSRLGVINDIFAFRLV
jgi:hypothetical protein